MFVLNIIGRGGTLLRQDRHLPVDICFYRLALICRVARVRISEEIATLLRNKTSQITNSFVSMCIEIKAELPGVPKLKQIVIERLFTDADEVCCLLQRELLLESLSILHGEPNALVKLAPLRHDFDYL